MAGCGNGTGQIIAPPAPPTFGPAFTLAVDPPAVSAPAAAVDASGTAVVLWSETGIAAGAALPIPYVVARENVSGVWAAARATVEPPAAGDATGDRIAGLQALAPATGIAAAWLRDMATASLDDRVQSALRSAADTWILDPVAAGVAGVVRSELAFAANDAGVQALAWIEPVGGVPQVKLRVRRVGPGGFAWSEPAMPVQSNPLAAARSPALAIDAAGRVMIVWAQAVGVAVPELRSRTFDATSGVFSLELPVHDNQPEQRAPRVVAIGLNQFVAVWEQQSGITFDLRARAGTSSNWEGVGSFTIDGRTEPVSGAKLLPGPLATALVAWQQGDRLFVSRLAVGVWSLPVEIGAGLVGVATDLRLAADRDGRALAVWIQRDGSLADLYFAPVSAGAPVVGAAALLESAAGAVSEPALAMNASGATVVAWLQHVSGQAGPELIARIVR